MVSRAKLLGKASEVSDAGQGGRYDTPSHVPAGFNVDVLESICDITGAVLDSRSAHREASAQEVCNRATAPLTR